jgi:hypothetical protein
MDCGSAFVAPEKMEQVVDDFDNMFNWDHLIT